MRKELRDKLEKRDEEIKARTIEIINDFIDKLYSRETILSGRHMGYVTLWDVEGILQEICKKYNILDKDFKEYHYKNSKKIKTWRINNEGIVSH